MGFQVIVVATDFGDVARAALDWAVDLAQALGSRIVLAHVFDLPIVGLPDAAILVGAETAARLSEDAQAGLDAEVARVKSRGVAVEGILRQGNPREVIPTIATGVEASMIVVGSHGRRGVMRTLLGSVAEDIMRRSKVPVSIVHGAVERP